MTLTPEDTRAAQLLQEDIAASARTLRELRAAVAAFRSAYPNAVTQAQAHLQHASDDLSGAYASITVMLLASAREQRPLGDS